MLKIVTNDNGDNCEYTYIMPEDKQIEQGKKFLSSIRSYTDVFSRDQDAFQPWYFNDIYAVVLLVNDVYYGHIYSWLSPNKQILHSIGIRNRIDSLFLKDTELEVPNVSRYLLHGVRQLGISLNVLRCCIVQPLTVMTIKLDKLGYKVIELNPSKIGVFYSKNIFPIKCLEMPYLFYNPMVEVDDVEVKILLADN